MSEVLDAPKRKRTPSKLTEHDPRRRQLGGRRAGAGRPPTNYAYDPRALLGQRDIARGKAGDSLADCVELWCMMVKEGLAALRGDAPRGNVDWGDVIRAAENIADRAGLIRKSELELSGEADVKLWGLTTYRSKDGERHELPPDPTGDPQPA